MQGDDKKPNSTDKTYGSYKVSEYQPQPGQKTSNYRVDESSGVPARATQSEQSKKLEKMAAELEASSDVDHKKKHKLGKDNEEFNQEYKSTRDALRGLSPFRFQD